MALVSSPLPDPGEAVGPAEAKVDAFLREIRSALNGGLSVDNLAASLADRVVVPVVSTPPGDAEDGEECHLLFPGQIVRFRFRAGSESAYKWEAVGAVPLVFEWTGSTPVLNGAPILGLSALFTAPFAGEYLVDCALARAEIADTFNGHNSLWIGPFNGAEGQSYATGWTPRFSAHVSSLSVGSLPPQGAPVRGRSQVVTLAAGGTVALGVACFGNHTRWTVAGGTMLVTPKRIAG